MLGKIILLLAVVAAGYWYWTGPYQQGRQSSAEERLQENARIMERCMHRESSMNTAAGMAGVGDIADDGNKLCAEKYDLYFDEGQWRSKDSAGNDY
jgi:hypothetical protein